MTVPVSGTRPLPVLLTPAPTLLDIRPLPRKAPPPGSSASPTPTT
ncbi:hypothetical protein KCH_77930 [Kitasatospora cheerisanensis KCTC 2395]|uniref:Uncharacterized protein n=1 Tax=Kitasatospora cheerisanensis KCTC 2395 TaxID=1348663 RepID=A0A066YQU5_9ACTN|nr:hypothetical protein KCH_77930 [Kitasatospora cheerisanensis KCTC 2395]